MILASQECISITETFPNIEIKLAFLPGILNMADSLTKFCQDPIRVINSANYRQGPKILTERDFENRIKIFYEVKEKRFKYTPLINEKEDLISLQKKLDNIFYEKPKSENINVVQISSDLKKISTLPDSQLNLIDNSPYFLRVLFLDKCIQRFRIIIHSSCFLRNSNSFYTGHYSIKQRYQRIIQC